MRAAKMIATFICPIGYHTYLTDSAMSKIIRPAPSPQEQEVASSIIHEASGRMEIIGVDRERGLAKVSLEMSYQVSYPGDLGVGIDKDVDLLHEEESLQVADDIHSILMGSKYPVNPEEEFLIPVMEASVLVVLTLEGDS